MTKIFKPFNTQQEKHFRIIPETNKGKIEGVDGKPTLTLDQTSQDAGVTLEVDEDGFGGTIRPDKSKPAPGPYSVEIDADADLSEQIELITTSIEGTIIEPKAQVLDVVEDEATDQPE